ncbi:ras-related protein Rab-32 [Salminus brasiliensis]|uniref:ras-related protein Rab-32 n=1 Tax=Salminus brasiliensis TaxID=930266 RepID=UPI003B830EEA
MSRGSKPGTFTEHLFKILVIGDLGVGKTRFVNRYVRNHFSSHLKLTLGVDFTLKVIAWDSKTMVRLQLWDISGHEHFKNMSRAYFKGARGALVVYDVTKESTLEGALSWKLDLDRKVVTDNGRPIPSVLLANKCDQGKVSSKEPRFIDRLCREKGFTGWFEVSAKENFNVDEAATFLVKNILLCEESDTEEGQCGDVTLKQASEKQLYNCC